MKRTQRIEDLITRTGLCCGTPTEYWPIIQAMLERAERHTETAKEENDSFYDPMMGAPGPWVELVAHFLNDRDFMEHGTGIGYSWLTPDGEMLLQWLREHGTDDKSWPDLEEES